MYPYVLTLHVLAATVWTGGHLVLALCVLPGAMKHNSPSRLLEFESTYERLGLPALLIQVVTGLWLAHRLLPNLSDWFSFDSPVSTLIAVKLGLLAATAALAIHARRRLIPGLTERDLRPLAYHIIPVTILSVLFVMTGVLFRTGSFA